MRTFSFILIAGLSMIFAQPTTAQLRVADASSSGTFNFLLR